MIEETVASGSGRRRSPRVSDLPGGHRRELGGEARDVVGVLEQVQQVDDAPPEERLQRKLKQAAAAVGVGQVLPGFTGRDMTFTETRDEIARLRREEASLFEEAGPSALSGEEYRRTLERELAHPAIRPAVLDPAVGSRNRIRPQRSPAARDRVLRSHRRPPQTMVPVRPAHPRTAPASRRCRADHRHRRHAHLPCPRRSRRPGHS